MMNQITATAINNILANINVNARYSFEELDHIARANGITVRTFMRYVNVMRLTEEVATEYTLAEVLNLLNSCAGDDCYGARWNFVERDGHIYNLENVTYYVIGGADED